MTNEFKKYRNRKNPEDIIEAKLREDGDFEIIDKACPIQAILNMIYVVCASNFNENFEEVPNE